MITYHTEIPMNPTGTRYVTDAQSCIFGIEESTDDVLFPEGMESPKKAFASQWLISVSGPPRKLSEEVYCQLLKEFGASENAQRAARVRCNRTP